MNLQLQKIKTSAELKQLLKLRQKVYLKSAVSGFLSDPDADIEADVFDGQSEFFGLYESMLPKVKRAFEPMHQSYMDHETIYA